MLTSYLVKCPHLGCDWFGSLLPSQDTDSWRSSVPTTPIAVFECPRCHREWQARVKGDDVYPLPVSNLVHAE
jgi:hypothetical protein